MRWEKVGYLSLRWMGEVETEGMRVDVDAEQHLVPILVNVDIDIQSMPITSTVERPLVRRQERV